MAQPVSQLTAHSLFQSIIPCKVEILIIYSLNTYNAETTRRIHTSNFFDKLKSNPKQPSFKKKCTAPKNAVLKKM